MYSVRLIQLQPLREYRRQAPPAPESSGPAGRGKTAELPSLRAQSEDPAPAASGGAELPEAADKPITREHRRFELPPTSRIDHVKQTVVQLDVPPDILLKQEIPLPTVVLWTEAEPPRFRKPFIAPPLKEIPKVIERLPAAPMLERPNQEINVADLNMASTILTETPHLVRPPAIAPPVSSAGPEPAKEIPRIGVADSSQSSAANLISLPTNPTRIANLLALPPANQIAPLDARNGGSPQGSGAGGADDSPGAGTQGRGLSASGAKGALGSAAGGSGGGRSGATAGGNGSAGSDGSGAKAGSGEGTAGEGTGTLASGNGAGTSSGKGADGSGMDGSSGALGDTAGLTRITLPKDGKFGVVVTGASASTPYPESVGALSGKIVYTVYLKVGLRKSWILQYCLPKAVDGAKRGTATPLDAPWPFLILRPDRLTDSDPDYIIVHGMLTSAGQFEQLALVFPAELEKRDLLLNSLKLWAFRPASRDGEPIGVEVLLIIPRETE